MAPLKTWDQIAKTTWEEAAAPFEVQVLPDLPLARWSPLPEGSGFDEAHHVMAPGGRGPHPRDLGIASALGHVTWPARHSGRSDIGVPGWTPIDELEGTFPSLGRAIRLLDAAGEAMQRPDLLAKLRLHLDGPRPKPIWEEPIREPIADRIASFFIPSDDLGFSGVGAITFVAHPLSVDLVVHELGHALDAQVGTKPTPGRATSTYASWIKGSPFHRFAQEVRGLVEDAVDPILERDLGIHLSALPAPIAAALRDGQAVRLEDLGDDLERFLQPGLFSLSITPDAPPSLVRTLDAVRRLLPVGAPFSVLEKGEEERRAWFNTLNRAHYDKAARSYYLASNEIIARLFHQCMQRHQAIHGRATGLSWYDGWLPPGVFELAAPLFVQALVEERAVPRRSPFAVTFLG